MGERRESILTLRELVNVPFRYQKLIGGIVGVSVVAAMLYCFLVEPVYHAEVKFVVKLGRERVAPLTVLPQVPYNVLLQETTQSVQDELEILKSLGIVYEVLPLLRDKLEEIDKSDQRAGLRAMISRGMEWLRRTVRAVFATLGVVKQDTEEEALVKKVKAALKISWQEDSNVIKVGFRWNNPQFAAFAAHTYGQAYLKLRNSLNRSHQSFEFYEDQIRLYEGKLREASPFREST